MFREPVFIECLMQAYTRPVEYPEAKPFHVYIPIEIEALEFEDMPMTRLANVVIKGVGIVPFRSASFCDHLCEPVPVLQRYIDFMG